VSDYILFVRAACICEKHESVDCIDTDFAGNPA
jgi:hypothetical protein